MKKKVTKVTTSSPLVPIGAGIGTGVTAFACAAICPPLLPLALLCAPLFWAVTKTGVAIDVDEATNGSESADDIAQEYFRNRKAGERGIDVSHTIHLDGGLFNIPMTRTYRYEIEDDDDTDDDDISF